jgi:hypothetical protein
VGAAVKSVSPEASLWASTYRARDGVGVAAGPGLFLLQCSPAEDRVRGISTKVSRTMLAAYLEDPNLAAWGKRALFVLLGHSAATPSAETLPEPLLWTVPAADLAQIVDSQGRGTINSETLLDLVDAGLAVEIHSFVRWAIHRWDLDTGRVSSQIPDRDGRSYWAPYGFGLNRPTPLGLAVGGLTEVPSTRRMAS